MDLTEKSLLVGICNWITKQPEYRKREITDPESLFYHVAPVKYAEFIMRFVREEVESSRHGNCTIFDVVGRSEQFTFEDMRKAFDAGAWEHHLHTFDSWIETQK